MSAAKYSSFTLALMVRNSRSARGAQRSLLMALALRVNPDKGYMCWPSYRQLADDTQLDAITLRRAAKALEEAGLILRRQRRYQSNVFSINVGLLAQHEAEARVARSRELELLTGDLEEVASDPASADDIMAAVMGRR